MDCLFYKVLSLHIPLYSSSIIKPIFRKLEKSSMFEKRGG